LIIEIVIKSIDKGIYMKKYDTERNYEEPSKMPRIIYPNDIMPDENNLSEASSEANRLEVKSLSSNPR
jgi:hypothetical protein